MDQIVAAFRRCRKPTDFYRLQISIEDFVTPQEFAELCQRRAELPAPAHDWLDKLSGLMFGEIAEPREYARTKIASQVWFYGADASRSGQAPARPDLLVCFCGLWQRLMSPISTILQHVDASRCDVVVLTDPSKRAFFHGIDGYAESFDAILSRLGDDVALDGYEAVKCFGTSAGGLPAIAAASRLGAERAVSVGGREARTYAPAMARHGIAPDDFCREFAIQPQDRTSYICVYPAEHEADRAGAEHYEHALGAVRIPVLGTGQHTLLFEFLKKHRLGSFLDALFFDDPESREVVL